MDNQNGHLDHFSQLPFHLVFMIISYLSFTDAFRLCMLRREWFQQKLWTSCNSFELHETSFNEESRRDQWLENGQGFRANVHRGIGKLRFVHFLNSTLFQITSPRLTSFEIQTTFDVRYKGYLATWIAFALSKRVQILVLDFTDESYNTIPVLPKVLYKNGESIRVMNLSMCCLGHDNFYSFKNLTILIMKRVVIITGKVTEILLDCPVLENLVLDECYNLCKVELYYGLEKLKRLVVKQCGPLNEGIEIVCLPMLEYFVYEGAFMAIEVAELDQLKVVVLDFQVDAHRPRNFGEIREALSGFMNVKIMTITTTPFKVLPLEFMTNLPMLQLLNLQELRLLTSMRKYELPGILSLLISAPSLQNLTIDSILVWPRTTHTNDDDVELPEEFWAVQDWSLYDLQCVRMNGFSKKEYEMEFLKFLLRNAINLYRVTITPRVGVNPDLHVEVFEYFKSVEFASDMVFIEWCLID